MNINIKGVLIILLALLTLNSCLKDKGSDMYNALPKFYVDTVGSLTRFEVFQSQSAVKLEPKVVFEGDTSRLTYIYRLYASSGKIDTVGTQRTLNAVISQAPDTYTLELEITNQQNGVKAFMLYTVVVLSPVPDGWMAIYEKAGSPGNSDVALIRSSVFISGLAQDSVYDDLYTTFNGGMSLEGMPRNTFDSDFDGGIFVATSKTVKHLQITDFRELRDFKDLFASAPPAVTNIAGIFNGWWGYPYIIADQTVYFSTWASNSFTFLGKSYHVDGYKAAPYTIFYFGANAAFYDEQHSRFMLLGGDNATTQIEDASAASRINLNGLSQDVQFIDWIQQASANLKFAFLKEKAGNGRYASVIDFKNTSRPDLAYFDLTNEPGIADARFFAANNVGQNAFYATSSAVYSFRYDRFSDTREAVKLGFQVSVGEEITTMVLNKAFEVFSAPADNDGTYLLVATWNATTQKGKVYHFNVDVTSGVISASGKSWAVKGKVANLCYKRR